jgi:uncharacterized protein (TIGR03437 family)
MRTTGSIVLLLAASGFAWADSYGKLPLTFEANQGQADAHVQFLSRLNRGVLFLASNEAVLRSGGDVVRMKLKGANPASRAEGADLQPGKSNYFVGSDPSGWRTGLANYGRVRFNAVYPGIDLVYYGKDGRLEYDWIIQSGADPAKIRLRFDGVNQVRVDGNGDLVLETQAGEIREKKPVVYQDKQTSGQKKEIPGRYVLHGRREAAFEVGEYDATKPLVIDPVLVYSSFLGGSGREEAFGIAVDSAGNAYLTGETNSTNFPTVNRLQGPGVLGNDAFVTKISADGSTKLYSTYLGGIQDDIGNAIAVDSAGNAYVTGNTGGGFPQVKALATKGSAFLTKLNPAGSALLFSTVFGGTGVTNSNAIALDVSGNAYITGYTDASDFPTLNPIQAKLTPNQDGGTANDAFVSKISSDGSKLIYSTYLGGNEFDVGLGIAVDPAGNAYVTGNTLSTNFPTLSPLDATYKGNATNYRTGFVTKINPSGSAFVYSTYLGGSGIDLANAIAADAAGNAYITGATESVDFPVANAFEPTYPFSQQAFVTVINATGSAYVYSTYLGGESFSQGFGIAVNPAGQVWVTGQSESTNFPTVNPLQTPKGNFNAVFVTQFSADGSSLLFSTILAGATGSSQPTAIALDSAGNAYVAGFVNSKDFPTVNAFQSVTGGGLDAFVFKISSGPPAGPVITSVVNGASFQSGLVPGAWATIKGSNLASSTDTWDKTIVNGKLPTTLDAVNVTVGGQPAYVYFISPGQINFIVPNIGSGPAPVVVMNSLGTSAAFSATAAPFGPAFFPWPNNQVVATRQDFSLAAKNGTFAGATTVPAKPGDVIILWGTGFGPTTPVAPVGQQTPSDATYSTATLPSVSINNLPATVYGAALAPGFAGLYQVAIQVPTSLTNGDWPIIATIGGVPSPTGMVLSVQQ